MRINRPRLILAGLVLLQATLPAEVVAQDAADQAAIIVTGQKPSEEQLRKQAIDYVRATAAEPIGGQFARWHQPLCPKAIGVAPQIAAIVERKIRATAQDVGAKLGRPSCDANLLIVFTDDVGAQMAAIVKRRPRLLQAMPAPEREALMTGERPVRWWYSTRIEGSDGKQANETSAMLMGGVIEGGGPIDLGDSPTVISSGHSTLIGTKVRAVVVDAGVLIDVERAEGHSLAAVAAYVAMVSLTRVKMSAAPTGGSSILNLFDAPPGAAAVTDLTQQDRAFLTALYRTKPDRTAIIQRGAIVAEMIRSAANR